MVITGASTGIGRGIAEDLLGHGYTVYGSVRTPTDAEDVHAALGDRFVPLLFDVCDEAAIQSAARQVADAVGSEGLAGLVNNAGIAITSPLEQVRAADLERQFAVNVFGTMSVTRAFLPVLRRGCSEPGASRRILNISTLSTSLLLPFMGPYVASKQALETLSTCLRRELLPYQIDVIVVAPGVVATPIWDKVEELNGEHDQAVVYGDAFTRMKRGMERMERKRMPVERVSRVVRRALEAPRPRTRYEVPISRFSAWRLLSCLPERWLDRMIGRRLGLTPGTTQRGNT